MRLFMYIAASDTIFYSNNFIMAVACTLKLPQLMDYTVFFSAATAENQHRALIIILNQV
jgi:hypothetical protein